MVIHALSLVGTGVLCIWLQSRSWWRHQMETFSALLAIWRGALMFSLICAWLNGWVNNGEAGDLRRCRAHYDVTVIWTTEHSRGHKKPRKRYITRNLLQSPGERTMNSGQTVLVRMYCIVICWLQSTMKLYFEYEWKVSFVWISVYVCSWHIKIL